MFLVWGFPTLFILGRSLHFVAHHPHFVVGAERRAAFFLRGAFCSRGRSPRCPRAISVSCLCGCISAICTYYGLLSCLCGCISAICTYYGLWGASRRYAPTTVCFPLARPGTLGWEGLPLVDRHRGLGVLGVLLLCSQVGSRTPPGLLLFPEGNG